MLDQSSNANASALIVIEKVATKYGKQILELSKMFDWIKKDMRAEFPWKDWSV